MDDWLCSIGLGDRVLAFRENRITEDQLCELTEADLRELGLTIGERKRFLRALELRNAEREVPAPTPRAPPEHGPDAIRAERRPLTIMFVDLVNSTGLGERLDEEDLLEAIRCYREFASAAVQRFGGRVARYVGDGILAYFCYPVANENDPERAIRAALAIARGISDIAAPVPTPLKVRIGLATGRVLVSDLFTGVTSEASAVIGSVPNLAARLQSLASPNGIVISEPTYARARRQFECYSLGRCELKGFDQPHEPWMVVGEVSRVANPSGPARASAHSVTPFTGREGEIEILQALWRKSVAGEGAAVLVTGEAGMGKSRLVEHLCQSIVSSGQRVMRFQASPFEEDSPLRPFIDYVVSEAGISPNEGAQSSLLRLDSFLGRAGQDEHATAIIGTLLGFASEDPAIAALLPDQLRQRTIAILASRLLEFETAGAICGIVEDLHWMDPTSRELLEAFFSQMRGRRVMLALTTREPPLDWVSRVDTVLRLRPLPPEHVSTLIRNVFATTPLTPQLIEYVTDKTDGVPLFVEEVARLLLQRATELRPVDRDGRPLSLDREIPASLDELLMAALDRAGPAKELAQVASVLGPHMHREPLAILSGLEPARFAEEITRLVSTGILEREIDASGESYRFHHALLRDAAYTSMLRERRRALHAEAARTLQRLVPELPSTHPEVLALHLSEAGLVEEAAPYWLESARRSLARSALVEASRVLRRGLTALERLAATQGGGSQTVMSLRLQFSALLGPVLISLEGPSAPETQELYTNAYELGHLLPEEPAHFPIYWGWWRLNTASEERAVALLDRARARGDPGLLLQAHHCCWSSYMNRGELGRCCEHIEAGLAIYRQGEYRQHARLYGNHDAKACAHGVLAQAWWMQGKLGTALQEERAGLEWAEDMDHLGTRVHMRGMALLHRTYRREYEAVLAHADEQIAMTARHGMAGAGAAALIFRGWALAQLGDPEGGLRVLEDGWARQREIATNEDYPVYLCMLTDVLTALGRAREAVQRIRSELDGFERTHLRIWIPELERVLGDAILATDPEAVTEARHHYVRAADLAAFQDVPMLGLRVALSEARLDAAHAPESAARRLADAMAKLPAEVQAAQGIDLQQARALAAGLPAVSGLGPAGLG